MILNSRGLNDLWLEEFPKFYDSSGWFVLESAKLCTFLYLFLRKELKINSSSRGQDIFVVREIMFSCCFLWWSLWSRATCCLPNFSKIDASLTGRDATLPSTWESAAAIGDSMLFSFVLWYGHGDLVRYETHAFVGGWLFVGHSLHFHSDSFSLDLSQTIVKITSDCNDNWLMVSVVA